MTIKAVVPFYSIQFDTTADRLAYTFVGDDIGRCVVRDFENGRSYNVVAAGTGASCMSAMGVGTKAVPVPLTTFRIVDANNDVAVIAVASGNGGQLAADSDPILRGRATVNNQELSWVANSVIPIMAEVPLPYDVDGTQDVQVELVVNSGTTNAATMGIATSWDGGSEVTDSASDSATKSATDHTITATIAAADVPDSPKHVTLRITPPSHSTNAIQLSGVRFLYVPK
jgi:hypothetical protein